MKVINNSVMRERDELPLTLKSSVYMLNFITDKESRDIADLGNPMSATRPCPYFVTSKPSPAPLVP